MAHGFATAEQEGGASQLAAEVNELTLVELRVPRGFVQRGVDPELPYLAVFLEGGLEKVFVRKTLRFGRGSALTVPVGARHDARFGADGARIVIVKPRSASGPAGRQLRRLTPLGGAGFGWLASRLVDELRATDAAAPLAAEGLAFELLAAAARESRPRPRRKPAWLPAAEELLRTRVRGATGLSEIAAAVGASPTQLARAFRAHHGVSAGEYGRRARLEWAAAEIRRGELALAEIAAEAGFADQSHFTRLFKRYVGTTPARYRASTRVPSR